MKRGLPWRQEDELNDLPSLWVKDSTDLVGWAGILPPASPQRLGSPSLDLDLPRWPQIWPLTFTLHSSLTLSRRLPPPRLQFPQLEMKDVDQSLPGVLRAELLKASDASQQLSAGPVVEE